VIYKKKSGKMFCVIFSFSAHLSLKPLVGVWKGAVFQNDQHTNDMTVSLFKQENGNLEGVAWVISDNTSLSELTDAYLGTVRLLLEKEKNEILITFTTESNPEPTKIAITKEEWSGNEINAKGTTKDNENYNLFMSKNNFACCVEKDCTAICVNLIHDRQHEISKSEKIGVVVNVMIGSFLGAFACLLLFFACFGDRNHHLKED
jgi:hypothetical protein